MTKQTVAHLGAAAFGLLILNASPAFGAPPPSEALKVMRSVGQVIGVAQVCDLDFSDLYFEKHRFLAWAPSTYNISTGELEAEADRGRMEGIQKQEATGTSTCRKQVQLDQLVATFAANTNKAMAEYGDDRKQAGSHKEFGEATIIVDRTIQKLDGESRILSFSKAIPVAAGLHTVELLIGCNRDKCNTETFKFSAQANYQYEILLDPNRIVVKTKEGTIADVLRPLNGLYVGKTEQQAEQQRIDQVRRVEQQAQEPLIRTIGARICKRDRETVYEGLVEDVAGAKIKIRINTAYAAGSPGFLLSNFKPSIIWDDSTAWYLCRR